MAVWRYTGAAGVSDPGVGALQFDQTMLVIVSTLAISTTGADGAQVASALDALAVDNTLTLRKEAEPSSMALFRVTSPAVAHGSWRAIGVQFLSGEGATLVASERVTIEELVPTLTAPTGSPYADRVIADGAIAYWRLGEPSGTSAQDTIGTRHGTISGAVALNQPGAIADGTKSMDFTGGQVLTPSTIPVWSSPFTVEAWINPRSVSDLQHAIVARGTSLPDEFGLYTTIGGQLQYTVPGVNNYPTDLAVSPNVWTHVAVTYDGSNVRVWVGGVAKAYAVVFPAQVANLPLTIGVAGGLTDPANGRIDEVALYTRALSAAELGAHITLAAVAAAAVGARFVSRYRWGAAA